VHNIKLTIAYDGSEFHGWQIQPGKPTVQGTLVEVAERLTQERIQIHGAGRTDSGVHALGQVAHFRTHSELSPAEFLRAFNALLPASIRVFAAEEVGQDFHARWQARGKTYQYRIFRGRVLPPHEAKYVVHDPYPLDAAAMARAAALFAGEHDFTSFAASAGTEDGERNRSPVREIFHSKILARRGTVVGGCGFAAAFGASEVLPQADMEEQAPDGRAAAASASGAEARVQVATQPLPALRSSLSERPEIQELIYEVRGRSFLRYMVRKIVGTLLDVGRGRLAPEDIPALFEARDRSRAGATAPPQGLYLVKVEYEEKWKW
jgi:tRNA pseudouridine38-40 synthase